MMKCKMMPMSPSSLNLFDQCPRKYQARYITKEFMPDSGSPALRRGNILHKLLEETVKNGAFFGEQIRVALDKKNTVMESWDNFPSEKHNCEKAITFIKELFDEGWDIEVEKEVAITETFFPCDWWDKRCYMRSKIDVLLVSPGRKNIVIWDWKTGNKKYINKFQFPFIALNLVPYFGEREYSAIDYLIDQGRSDDAIVIDTSQEAIYEVKATIDKLKQAHDNNEWSKKTNALCRFCEVKTCQYQGK